MSKTNQFTRDENGLLPWQKKLLSESSESEANRLKAYWSAELAAEKVSVSKRTQNTSTANLLTIGGAVSSFLLWKSGHKVLALVVAIAAFAASFMQRLKNQFQ